MSLSDLLFLRRHGRCPPWFCFTFDNRLRRLIHDATRLFGTYIRPGDKILDIGAGKGVFTIPLAKMAGEGGRIVAVDAQQAMLEAILRRARRAGIEARVRTYLAIGTPWDIEGPFDFALIFWMLHEVPDRAAILGEVRRLLKPGGRAYLAEPRGHVKADTFEMMVGEVAGLGLMVESRPRVALSHAAVFIR